MMNTPHKQTGVMLLEALIGILIFSLGVLALVGMQAAALRGVSDARYRTQAVSFANQILQQIALNAERDATTTNIKPASVADFQYQPDGTNCEFKGSTANATAAAWADQVMKVMPGATKAMQQVKVEQPNISTNQVTITVCWQTPEDDVPRKHILISYIN